MKKNIIIILGILGVILLVLLGTFGGWIWRYYSAPIEGKVGMREKVHSADYRLYSYDHFFNMYSEIKAYEDQIKNQKEYLESINQSSEEAQRIRRNINAIKNSRNSVIRKYNADAMKEDSRGQFLADDLPYQISPGGNI